MQITIDIDVLENLLIHNNRRNNDQQSVFALVLGKQIGPNSFHITDFIYKYIEYNNDNKIENKKSDLYLKFSQSLNGYIIPTLECYFQNNPFNCLIGAITTMTDLKHDIVLLYQNLYSNFLKLNKLKVNLIFVLNPSNFSNIRDINAKKVKMNSKLEYKLNGYTVVNDKRNNIYQFNKIKNECIKYSMSKHHEYYASNIENNIISTINDKMTDKKKIINKFNFSVCNLLNSIEKYLDSFLSILNSNIDSENLLELSSVVCDLEELFNEENYLIKINNENKKINIISEISNILASQIKIANDINQKFLINKDN